MQLHCRHVEQAVLEPMLEGSNLQSSAEGKRNCMKGQVYLQCSEPQRKNAMRTFR